MFRKTRLLFLTMLIACWASTGCTGQRSGTVSASVSGVNYTDQDIVYRLFDPADPEQKVLVAEDIGPFAAGGILCCYDVPKTWKAGTKVGVSLQTYDNEAGDYRPAQTFIVELPPYDKSGKAGDVWFIAYPDNTVGVVSTAYRPNSEAWPGKIKGWPKPSLAFQREIWERDMKLAQEALEGSKELKQEFEQDPRKYLEELWILRAKNDPAKVYSKFTGPDDPEFLDFERKKRESSLKYSQDKVDQLMKVKP